jgi:hypothetical protein
MLLCTGGQTVDTIPNAVKNYLHNVNARFDKPLRIRIGGNSMDGSVFVFTRAVTLKSKNADLY